MIATNIKEQHLSAIKDVMKAIKDAGLTLNPNKCTFGKKQVKFLGMVISKDGVCPNPDKIKALNGLAPQLNREELKSFICMMKINSEFIESFAFKINPLCQLLNLKERFS